MFNEVEKEIPLHRATRHLVRLNYEENPSASTAKWKFFIYTLSTMRVDWERRGRTKVFGDRLRLRAHGKCRFCNNPLYRLTWSVDTQLRCSACGYVCNNDTVEGKAREEPAQPEPGPPRPQHHPLIGYTVTRLDGRGTVEMRNGTIIDVVESGTLAFGLIAVITYRDHSRVDLVALPEFGDPKTRHFWRLRRPSEANDGT